MSSLPSLARLNFKILEKFACFKNFDRTHVLTDERLMTPRSSKPDDVTAPTAHSAQSMGLVDLKTKNPAQWPGFGRKVRLR